MAPSTDDAPGRAWMLFRHVDGTTPAGRILLLFAAQGKRPACGWCSSIVQASVFRRKGLQRYVAAQYLTQYGTWGPSNSICTVLDVFSLRTLRIFSWGLKLKLLCKICSAVSDSGTLKMIPVDLFAGADTCAATLYPLPLIMSVEMFAYLVARASSGVLTTTTFDLA